MLKEYTVENFIKEVESNSHAPGGGSVAALLGTLGAALSVMVFNLTTGKNNFNEYSDDIKELITNQLEEVKKLEEELMTLIDKDSQAFIELMNCFKLPKNSEEEKVFRASAIEHGYKKALEVPLETAKLAYKVYEYILTTCIYGNKNAITDAGVAALSIQAAIEGAILNVRVNLSNINNSCYREKVTNKCNELIKKGKEKRDEILAIVDKVIG